MSLHRRGQQRASIRAQESKQCSYAEHQCTHAWSASMWYITQKYFLLHVCTCCWKSKHLVHMLGVCRATLQFLAQLDRDKHRSHSHLQATVANQPDVHVFGQHTLSPQPSSCWSTVLRPQWLLYFQLEIGWSFKYIRVCVCGCVGIRGWAEVTGTSSHTFTPCDLPLCVRDMRVCWDRSQTHTEVYESAATSLFHETCCECTAPWGHTAYREENHQGENELIQVTIGQTEIGRSKYTHTCTRTCTQCTYTNCTEIVFSHFCMTTTASQVFGPICAEIH